MAHSDDDGAVAHPEVLTLHWEGPDVVSAPPDFEFEEDAEEERFFEERAREFRAVRRSEQGQILWAQIAAEAARRGDADLWRRKLDAFSWVKLQARGNARDYARARDVKHATVRSWIADVAKLAYQVGYRLHEDKLLLVGDAPVELRRLREIVNRDAASDEAWQALLDVEDEFRGRDPYFHLNEGHLLRAHGRLRESDETLREGLTIAEAPRVRSLLWNARGQTLWECGPDSDEPVEDHLEHAEMCFRRAAILDRSTYFPFVNLAQLAVDARDYKRAEYWLGELAAARKGMDEVMKESLAEYLAQAEWSAAVEGKRFWRSGPRKWIAEVARRGALILVVCALALGLAGDLASAATASPGDPIAHGGRRSNSGAGGN